MELVRMWRSPKMIIIFAAVTAVFAVVSLFCTDFVLIPGYSSVRPVNGLPVTMGLMFGPAGALGCAAGNVIGDALRGELGWTSVGGAVGNFLFAAIPYWWWGAVYRRSPRTIPNIFAWRRLASFVIMSAAAAAVCALIVAAFIALAGGEAFWAAFAAILQNNILGAYIVGLPLFVVLPILVNTTGLYWRTILRRSWD